MVAPHIVLDLTSTISTAVLSDITAELQQNLPENLVSGTEKHHAAQVVDTLNRKRVSICEGIVITRRRAHTVRSLRRRIVRYGPSSQIDLAGVGAMV
jgi:hypothetical protein